MTLEILQSFPDALLAYPYVLIFFGMLLAGDVILLPAIYLAATGRLEIAWVLTASVTATLISDAAWYVLGRRFPASALARLPGRGTGRVVAGLERLFRSRGAEVVFMSKFVYGTRVTAQVLAGLHDMPLRTYLLANTLGVLALTGVLVGAAYAIVDTARRLDDFVSNMEIAFLAFIGVAVLGYYLVGRWGRKKWLA